MTPSERDIESYIATATAGFGEIAESLLGAPSARLPDGERLTAATRFTAFVPVLANEKTIYVGVGSSLAGAVVATRSFLGFEPTDDDPSVEDVADAVGELANMTAGVVQRELAEYGKSELGLPVTLAELEDSTRTDVAIDVDGYGTGHIMMVGRHLASLQPADGADSGDGDAGDPA